MYLSAYHFEGDPAALTAAHERMVAQFPPGALDLHLCVTSGTGIVVLDACPSREVAEAFQRGPEFAEAVSSAGLPAPRIESLGDIVWSNAGTS
jgi:hypothetical protein